MTRARDLADLISSGSIESSEITSIDASKLSGTIADARIPNLAASKITSGQFADARIADLAATKLTGSIADARIPASAVSQHATSFDDNKIVNDISTLALRQASNENKGAYNTNSMYVDVFQDDTGLGSETNTDRNASEYVSTFGTAITSVSNLSTTFTDASSENHSITQSNSQWHTTHGGALGGGAGIYQYTGSNNGSLNITNNNSFIHDFGSSDFTIEMFGYNVQSSSHRGIMGYADGGVQKWQFATNPTLAVRWWASNDGSNWNMGSNGNISGNNVPSNQWFHMAVVRHGNNFYGLGNGNRQDAWTGSGALIDENSDFRVGSTGNVPPVHHGYIDQIRISNIARYTNTTYTVPTGSNGYVNDANTKLIIGSKFTQNIVNATGNFISNAITTSSTNKMGAIITYQDQAGTNALNTDIVLQLSADNGSNFTTATMTAMPDFASGIKMAKVNDLAVTAGTQLKYKISFANQSSGSKEARIRGVSLQY